MLVGACASSSATTAAGTTSGANATCTVTFTILQLPEGSACGAATNADGKPATMCAHGLYGKGSECGDTVAGVCTKAPTDCSQATGGPARDCNGTCYPSACAAAQAGSSSKGNPPSCPGAG